MTTKITVKQTAIMRVFHISDFCSGDMLSGLEPTLAVSSPRLLLDPPRFKEGSDIFNASQNLWVKSFRRRRDKFKLELLIRDRVGLRVGTSG